MKLNQLFQNIFGGKNSDGEILVNNSAPDFSLPDENGVAVQLSQFRGKRDVLIFIIRGDFCPYCQMMLRTYQKEQDKFKEKNIMLMSVAPGPVDINHEIVKKFGLEYKVLCDKNLQIIKQYGALDEKDKQAYPEGMPIPASFLIDKNGVVRYCSRADESATAFEPSVIYNALEKLN